ncbi:MAG: electron transfer flavoprotein-ubiquinone oxidoreductase [Geminicoccaceae bacterium]|nr:electron transfer flavoprotein-ubiquinone oxidoreductase [Geminicoccaceae bacterium]
MEREAMEFDVVIVGAGPSGLAASIRLMQLAAEQEREITVCVIEKGSEVGAHILSGACIETRALDELLPDWKELGAPLNVEAAGDSFVFLTEKNAYTLPTPPQMHNEGNYIVSLGQLCRWLAEQAEGLGVEIYPGFAAAEVLHGEDGAVKGVATGDMGITKDGEQGPNYQPGMELRARVTLFAEGCRGSLTRTLFEKFDLRRNAQPQTYGIGIKELWEVRPEKHRPGHIMHTIGWPMDSDTYGGSWLYHFEDNLVSLGFVIGLDYANPHLSPFDEMQRFKTHPKIRELLEGGRRVAYGARALSEGGLQSLPELIFPGGALIGDCAGFLNVPKIKGTHTAMKSGMLAAEAVMDALAGEAESPVPSSYPQRFRDSWLYEELHGVRNIRPAFRWGLFPALALNAIDTFVFRGGAPWTLSHHGADHTKMKTVNNALPIRYPRPDGVITFDKPSSVFLSNTNHEEDQPVHLRLKDASVPIAINLVEYDAPEQRYCPAGVYEIVRDDDGSNPRLQINAQNCVHCKTCDIKDPTQNIIWTTPEGGGGPNYPNM